MELDSNQYKETAGSRRYLLFELKIQKEKQIFFHSVNSYTNVFCRVADPHSFHPDPDPSPAFFLG
jgi:hypothetical protein